jgi:hypothetical protein
MNVWLVWFFEVNWGYMLKFLPIVTGVIFVPNFCFRWFRITDVIFVSGVTVSDLVSEKKYGNENDFSVYRSFPTVFTPSFDAESQTSLGVYIYIYISFVAERWRAADAGSKLWSATLARTTARGRVTASVPPLIHSGSAPRRGRRGVRWGAGGGRGRGTPDPDFFLFGQSNRTSFRALLRTLPCLPLSACVRGSPCRACPLPSPRGRDREREAGMWPPTEGSAPGKARARTQASATESERDAPGRERRQKTRRLGPTASRARWSSREKDGGMGGNLIGANALVPEKERRNHRVVALLVLPGRLVHRPA